MFLQFIKDALMLIVQSEAETSANREAAARAVARGRVEEIRVSLSDDRRHLGRVTLLREDAEEGATEWCAVGFIWRDYAASRGNPSADPTRAGGDVPFGTYRLTEILHRQQAPWLPPEEDTGHLPILVFRPTEGEAVIGGAFGRNELLVYAGDEAATFGGLRLIGEDLWTAILASLDPIQGTPSLRVERNVGETGRLVAGL